MEFNVGEKVILKPIEELDEDLRAKVEDDYKKLAGKEFTIFSKNKTRMGIYRYELEEDEDMPELLAALLSGVYGFEITKCMSFTERYFKKKEEKVKVEHTTITDLNDTKEMMTSTNYRERFVAEYYQLKIRIDKLQRMVDNWDSLAFEPVCPKELLKQQLVLMKGYLSILEERAKLEKVEL